MKYKLLIPAAIILCAFLLVYGYYIEPNQLKITALSVDSPRINNILAGKRLFVVADLHIKKNDGRPEIQVAEKIREMNPDYVFIAGDLMSYRTKPEPVIDWMKNHLPQNANYFAVLGDSDTLDGARNCSYCHVPGKKTLRTDLPVKFLRDQFGIIDTDKGQVVVAGTDPEKIEPDLSFLDKAPAGLPVILISHYPEAIVPASKRNIDLIFSGDTHGGQIMAPRFLYSLFFREGRARYLEGKFRLGETQMYVTRGIGMSILPLRIGAKPEVVVIDF